MAENAKEFDVVVIGSGPGGYVAAIRARQLGLKTACIEKEKTFGGTCLNVGCIPSKALLVSSEHVEFLREKAKEHGISCGNISFDFGRMMERKEQVVEGLVTSVAGLLKRNEVQAFQGTASFVSPHEIEVLSAAGKTRIYGKNFILATGSCPIELPFLRFDEKIVLSSTGALSLKRVPEKLLVIGAGVIGVELASVYQRLGAQVTIVEMLEAICPAMDGAVSRTLLRALTKQGISFHLGAEVLNANVSEKGVTLSVKTKEGNREFSGDRVLVSIGRRPYTEGLGLEKIGVEKTKKGFVAVDQNLRTSTSHIFAIGDLIDGPMLAHKASEEGVAAVELIAGLKPHVNYAAIPNVIYTHPEAAAIGFTEEEVKSLGVKYLAGSVSFKGNPRAKCSGDNEGLVKVIGEEKRGRLIGMHIIGPSASELIGEGMMAMEKRATLQEIASAPHAHPTLSEAIKEACLQALGRAVHL